MLVGWWCFATSSCAGKKNQPDCFRLGGLRANSVRPYGVCENKAISVKLNMNRIRKHKITSQAKTDATASVFFPAGATFVRRCGALYVSKRGSTFLQHIASPLFSLLLHRAQRFSALFCGCMDALPRERASITAVEKRREGGRDGTNGAKRTCYRRNRT